MSKALWFVALMAALVSLGLWGATGFHGFTKYQVVEQVPYERDPNDPFADTGLFDDDGSATQTEVRDEFHFGLLPTPQGIFDKHAISVVSTGLPLLAAALLLSLWNRFRRMSSARVDAPSRGARGQAVDTRKGGAAQEKEVN